MLFRQIMADGGPVMWVIFVVSLLAMWVFVTKWFQFHREQIDTRELMKGLTNLLKRDGIVEAVTLCDNTPGPAARVVSAAILAYERGETDFQRAVQEGNLEEVPRLERYLTVLGTIGYLAPLLGLLGTVLGIMEAFQVIHDIDSVYLSASQLSGAINMALITTAAGLAVAIPCYAGYNYLLCRLNDILLDMEKASLEIVNFLEHRVAEKNAGAAE